MYMGKKITRLYSVFKNSYRDREISKQRLQTCQNLASRTKPRKMSFINRLLTPILPRSMFVPYQGSEK